MKVCFGNYIHASIQIWQVIFSPPPTFFLTVVVNRLEKYQYMINILLISGRTRIYQMCTAQLMNSATILIKEREIVCRDTFLALFQKFLSRKKSLNLF